jgi:xylulokinase
VAAPALLAIDLGTSAIKVVAFATDGTLLTSRREATPTTRYADGRAEHDVEALWEVVRTLLRATVAALEGWTIEGVGVASVGEAGVPLDGRGMATHPGIAWFDTRGEVEAEWWRARVGEEAIGRITGLPIDAHNSAYRLMWLRDHAPEAFARTRHWLSLVGLIVQRLTGAIVSDMTLASRTGLLDQASRSWSLDLCSVAELDPALLPDVFESGTRVGGVTTAAAAATGLRQGTPVVPGGHDRLCACFASRGASDLPVDSTGSAEALVLSVPDYTPRAPAEAGYIACYTDVVPGRYVLSARVGYAAALTDWYHRELEGSTDAAPSLGIDSKIEWPLRYSGLLVYPSFGRVVAPEWDPDCAPGAILGLTLAHTRADVLQALVEGAAFSLRANLLWLEKLTGGSIPSVLAEGGLTSSRVWMQLKADVTGRPMVGVRLTEATALGAALLAGVGAGVYRDHAAAAAAVDRDLQDWAPDPDLAAVYADVYEGAFRLAPRFISQLAPVLRDAQARSPRAVEREPGP